MSRSKRYLLLLAIGLCSSLPFAYSQKAEDQTTVVSFQDDDPTKLTGEEQLKRANTRYASAQKALQHMENLQEAAKRAKDLLRLDCINEKIVEVRGLLEIVKPVIAALDQAIKDGNQSGRVYEYTKVTIAYDRTVQLSRQAETCAGEILTYSGDTKVDVTNEGGGPEDPTAPPEGQLPIDPPTDFSPIQ